MQYHVCRDGSAKKIHKPWRAQAVFCSEIWGQLCNLTKLQYPAFSFMASCILGTDIKYDSLPCFGSCGVWFLLCNGTAIYLVQFIVILYLMSIPGKILILWGEMWLAVVNPELYFSLCCRNSCKIMSQPHSLSTGHGGNFSCVGHSVYPSFCLQINPQM